MGLLIQGSLWTEPPQLGCAAGGLALRALEPGYTGLPSTPGGLSPAPRMAAQAFKPLLPPPLGCLKGWGGGCLDTRLRVRERNLSTELLKNKILIFIIHCHTCSPFFYFFFLPSTGTGGGEEGEGWGGMNERGTNPPTGSSSINHLL